MTAKLCLTVAKSLRLEGVDSAIVLPESLSLEIGSLIYGTDELVLEIRNGRKYEKRKVKGGDVIDLSSFLFAGSVEMTVHMIARGTVAKKWSVVPLVIRDIEGGFEIFDEIKDLQNRVSILEEKTKIVL